MSKFTDSTSRLAAGAARRVRRTRHPHGAERHAALLWRARLTDAAGNLTAWVVATWSAPRVRAVRQRVIGWQGEPRTGISLLLLGTALVTLLVLLIDRLVVPLSTPGIVYLPLIAMLSYYWSWRLGALASALQLACVYFLFLVPVGLAKPLTLRGAAQLVTLAAVNVFTLLLVQLARAQRDTAARQASRSAALNEVGHALSSELDEERLLRLIARTARELTGAGFAAFTLRPLDAHGQPLVPAHGNLFHLAAVVGVTPEQEALFRRMPLGGEGLLAPIFRNGVSVRVADALAMIHTPHAADSAADSPQVAYPASMSSRMPGTQTAEAHSSRAADTPLRSQAQPRAIRKEAARAAAISYAHGQLTAEQLRAVGIPRGHPLVRSFLGVPLLDREGRVRGGLLLGHTEPDRFTEEDERLLSGLAAQAAVALENARLYRSAQMQARELDAIFESISDAVMLVDGAGAIIRENRAASALRAEGGVDSIAVERVVRAAEAARGAKGDLESEDAAGVTITDLSADMTLTDAAGEERQYTVSAAPLRETAAEGQSPEAVPPAQAATGAVVVWHDLTETRRLLRERQARAETDTRRALLQLVIDQLPGGIYLVRGAQARLMLANQAARDVWGADWPEGQPMAAFLAQRGVRILSPEGQPLAESELATVRAVRSGEAVRHHQEIIRRPDGTALPVLLNAVALDPRVIPFGRASTTADERETAPMPAPVELSGDAHERSALVVLQDVTALKDAERVKDEFITIAAHELKTPMTAVKGYTDMLRRRSANAATSGEAKGSRGQPHSQSGTQAESAAAALAPWQLDALETIDQAMGRLAELTEDLLDVARLQAGRVELHLEPHDLAALARRVAKRLQFSTERHTLRVESEAEYVVALLDVRRIEQVVGNLLSNAIKYSPDGGPIMIAVRAAPERAEALLTVRDRGIGIPAAQQGRLFARFARADNALAAGIGGTGLGLYLSRELVERHGGRIWFESTEGAGSAFSIALPLAGEDDEEDDPF